VDGCAKPERPPSVLLRAGFAAREELADDASEVDLKEDLKRIVSQAHLPFDGQQINAALDVVTRLKPLKAELERHRRRQHVG
jgi:hypothetical protein